jgi:hypothetical protein
MNIKIIKLRMLIPSIILRLWHMIVWIGEPVSNDDFLGVGEYGA